MEGGRGTAELVPKRITSVKCIIAYELPCASVKDVAAAPSHNADHSTENSTILGLVIVRLDLELLNGVNDGWNDVGAGVQFGVNHTIQHIKVRTVGLTLN